MDLDPEVDSRRENLDIIFYKQHLAVVSAAVAFWKNFRCFST